MIEHLQGAVGRVPVGATAFAHREAPFNLEIISVWRDPAQTEAHVAWGRRFWEALEGSATGGTYVNYLVADEGDRPEVAYGEGPNLARLREVKARWDPHNVFRLNSNITPADRLH
jgi:FAD/FMN-containing dehydrogenase